MPVNTSIWETEANLGYAMTRPTQAKELDPESKEPKFKVQVDLKPLNYIA